MVHVGSTYQGIIEWDECETMHDHNVIITVTAVKHEPIFNNVVYVRATQIGDSVRYQVASFRILRILRFFFWGKNSRVFTYEFYTDGTNFIFFTFVSFDTSK